MTVTGAMHYSRCPPARHTYSECIRFCCCEIHQHTSRPAFNPVPTPAYHRWIPVSLPSPCVTAAQHSFSTHTHPTPTTASELSEQRRDARREERRQDGIRSEVAGVVGAQY
eukprot:1158210-Rhodomonas_salina.1